MHEHQIKIFALQKKNASVIATLSTSSSAPPAFARAKRDFYSFREGKCVVASVKEPGGMLHQTK